jgi:hypothetical protein
MIFLKETAESLCFGRLLCIFACKAGKESQIR